MVSRKELLFLIALIVIVTAFIIGFRSQDYWFIDLYHIGRNVNSCGLVVQGPACGIDLFASFPTQVIVSLIFGWVLWSMTLLLGFNHLLAKYTNYGNTKPSLARFILTSLVSVVVLNIISFRLWGAHYEIDPTWPPTIITQKHIFIGTYVIISIFTVGLIALASALLSSGVKKLKRRLVKHIT